MDEAFRLLDKVTSIGGPSQGIDVVIWGPFLEQGMLEVRQVKLVQVIPKQNAGGGNDFSEQQKLDGIIEQVASMSNGKLLIAHFDDFSIPKGYISNDSPKNAKQIEKLMSEQSLSEFYLDIRGIALLPGKEDMCIACAPHANRKEGQTGYSIEVNVSPAQN